MKEIESNLMLRFIPTMAKRLLPAELRIVEIKGEAVKSGAAKVRVDKISLKGLSFLSELLFPVDSSIILDFQVSLSSEMIHLRGTVQTNWQENRMNFYEVAFIKDEGTKRKLKVLLECFTRQFIPLHLRAEYYYNYFSEANYDLNNSRINLLT